MILISEILEPTLRAPCHSTHVDVIGEARNDIRKCVLLIRQTETDPRNIMRALAEASPIVSNP